MTLPVSAQWAASPGAVEVVPAVAISPDTPLTYRVAPGGGFLVEGGRAERCGDDGDGCPWGGQIQLAQQPADQPGADRGIQLAQLRSCPVDLFPEMVILPGGTFRMGDLSGNWDPNERPVHEVRIRRFAVSRYEVTQEQYQAFVSATGRSWTRIENVPDRGPAVNMRRRDAQAFIEWLNRRTGQRYRLLTEAEWEYAARGGTETDYYSGDDTASLQANCDIDASCSGDRHETLAPVGSYPPNPFGLYDMAGNAAEWVEDCWHDSYEGAPVDGSAWVTGCDDARITPVRGGSWFLRTSRPSPGQQRSAFRFFFLHNSADHDIGFRLARDL